jgi:cystathionine beta-lyase/cystathionine gamma-synthase
VRRDGLGEAAGYAGDRLHRPGGGPRAALGIGPGLARLSCGLEDAAELIADVRPTIDAA